MPQTVIPQAVAPATAQAPAVVPPVAVYDATPTIKFAGTTSNFVPGVALLFAGMMAFPMGMTDVFFAEATAWTFVAWGALFIYSGLLDMNETYEVTDEALIIRNPWRIWAAKRTWDWARVNRLDVVVKRREAEDRNVVLQVYYTPKGEISLERQDRVYDPTLAQLIVDRAELRPADKDTPKDVTKIPRAEKAVYTWQ
jgi:hypothetical protein